jgi:hypothetical protein
VTERPDERPLPQVLWEWYLTELARRGLPAEWIEAIAQRSDEMDAGVEPTLTARSLLLEPAEAIDRLAVVLSRDPADGIMLDRDAFDCLVLCYRAQWGAS